MLHTIGEDSYLQSSITSGGKRGINLEYHLITQLTLSLLTLAILYRLENLVFKAILSIHGSNQNRILSPFPTLKTANLSTLATVQNLSKGFLNLNFLCHLSVIERGYSHEQYETTLHRGKFCSAMNLHPHLARRAMFLNFSLFNPRPPSPWDLETNSHFTRRSNLLPFVSLPKEVPHGSFNGIRDFFWHEDCGHVVGGKIGEH